MWLDEIFERLFPTPPVLSEPDENVCLTRSKRSARARRVAGILNDDEDILISTGHIETEEDIAREKALFSNYTF